ncbi:CapA family protein [Sorangium sp. So ce363]|uniref:CapA family protein n=1 Tax=Sorangium sp. So ce363 TaxID=3133304 RepID=UPI003F5EC75D
MILFLCGDVMTGRGIDQVLPHPSDSLLYEPWANDARAYVELAEAANGPIPRPVDFSYVWGDALAELERVAPDARIVNLETSVTRSDDAWMGKGIHYRMHPENVPCLTAALIDVCTLANNHVLDWGRAGLIETIEVLRNAGVRTAGAGRDRDEARAPAVIDLRGNGRVLVFAFGVETSGIPLGWAATEARTGIDLLPELSESVALAIGERVQRVKRANDVVVASIHWGGNWGYTIPDEYIRFAHWLIEGGVDVVHGHSSHHPQAIEVHDGKLVLYGCGDFINDYEGIHGHEEFRGDLALMYFASVEPATGKLKDLTMTPMQLRRLRATRAQVADARWLAETIARESRAFGAETALGEDGRITLRWRAATSTWSPRRC